jgi:hypothetical protein
VKTGLRRPPIGSERTSHPSSNFDTNPTGMQHPPECPKGMVLLRILGRWK